MRPQSKSYFSERSHFVERLKERIKIGASVALAVFALVGGVAGAQPLQVDPALPAYQPVDDPRIAGTFISVGSDTMNNLMALWAEGFARHYPQVRIEIEGAGSGTAPPALIAGASQFGPMSRPLTASERNQFEARYGYEPTQLGVALDALAVYVHRDNPIDGLTLPQVDAIFSSTRLCGELQQINVWGQAGLSGAWANRPISLYGRNSASGTYAFFKDEALCGGDYKSQVNEQPGSASVVQAVTEDLYGVGYSGIGYRTSGVRPVPLAFDGSGRFAEPTLENVVSGAYPLGRFLYITLNIPPNGEIHPMTREFLRFVFSREGQEIVVRDGYLPLTAEAAAEQLSRALNPGS